MNDYKRWLSKESAQFAILLLTVFMTLTTAGWAQDKKSAGQGRIGPKDLSYDLLAGGNQRVSVDCNAGGSVQKAIWSSAPGGMLHVEISGTCREVIFINRDKVWLKGRNPGTDKIVGQGPETQCAVNVVGAQSVYVEGLTITSEQGLHTSSGICAINSAHVDVRDAIVEGHPDTGIFYSDSSSGDIKNTVVRNNRYGVNFRQSSAGDIYNTTVSDSDRCNFIVDQNSAVRFWAGNRIIHKKTKSGRKCAGVTVRHGSTLRIRGENNKIDMQQPTKSAPDYADAGPLALFAHSNANIRVGDGHLSVVGNIRVFNNSSIELYDVDVKGNIYADGFNGTMFITDTGSVKENISLSQGNIFVRAGSMLAFTPSYLVPRVRVDGNIVCISPGYNLTATGSFGLKNMVFEQPAQKFIGCEVP